LHERLEARVAAQISSIGSALRLKASPGEFVSVTRLKIDPVWDPIRNDPGFQKLLSEPEPVTIYK
jgi:hypothetical protein